MTLLSNAAKAGMVITAARQDRVDILLELNGSAFDEPKSDFNIFRS
jgi:hypothetical protein